MKKIQVLLLAVTKPIAITLDGAYASMPVISNDHIYT